MSSARFVRIVSQLAQEKRRVPPIWSKKILPIVGTLQLLKKKQINKKNPATECSDCKNGKKKAKYNCIVLKNLVYTGRCQCDVSFEHIIIWSTCDLHLLWQTFHYVLIFLQTISYVLFLVTCRGSIELSYYSLQLSKFYLFIYLLGLCNTDMTYKLGGSYEYRISRTHLNAS